MKVTVFGAGNGGYALAFHLVQLGHEVLMHVAERFKADLESVEKTGCIEAVDEHDSTKSVLHGVSKISEVTTDMKKACEFSNVLMLIVPSFGQNPIFEGALPYLTDKHVIISMPGNFAFTAYTKIIQEKSQFDATKDFPFTMVETSSIPYACRKIGGNQVFIVGMKSKMQVGVFPSTRTEQTMKIITPLFGLKLQVMKNVLETGFYNLNFVLHPTISLYNAGWIEATKGDFLFYKEGATRGVLNILNSVDQERIKIAKAIGFDSEDVLTIWKDWYGDVKSKTLEELMQNATWYESIKAPASLNNRYITEDLNFVLVPIVEHLARKHSIPTPVMDAVITSAKHLTGLPVHVERSLDAFPRSYNDI